MPSRMSARWTSTSASRSGAIDQRQDQCPAPMMLYRPGCMTPHGRPTEPVSAAANGRRSVNLPGAHPRSGWIRARVVRGQPRAHGRTVVTSGRPTSVRAPSSRRRVLFLFFRAQASMSGRWRTPPRAVGSQSAGAARSSARSRCQPSSRDDLAGVDQHELGRAAPYYR